MKKIQDLLSSCESISFQEDEELIKDLGEQIVEIQLTLKSIKTKPEESTAIRALYDQLGDTIYKRFGIPYRMIHSDSFGYTIPVQAGLNSVIFPSQDKLTNYVTSISKYSKLAALDITKLTSAKQLVKRDSLVQLYKHIDESYTDIRKHLGRLTVDLSNVKIKGLDPKNKNNVAILAIGFHSHVQGNGKDLTTRESVAILLHEISHTFTTLAYTNYVSNVFFNNAMSLVDGKDNSKVFSLLDEITSQVSKAKTNKEAIVILLRLTKATSSNSIMSGFNSEILADQFSTRFGLGRELAEVFNMFPTLHTRTRVDRQEIDTLNMLVLSFFALITAMAMSPIPITLSIIVLSYYLTLIILQAISVAVGGKLRFTTEKPHEDTFDRIRRIKLDSIRILRTEKISTTARTELIGSITVIDRILEGLSRDRSTKQLFTNWLTGNSTTEGFVELTNRVEALMENDLHYLINKHKEK